MEGKRNRVAIVALRRLLSLLHPLKESRNPYKYTYRLEGRGNSTRLGYLKSLPCKCIPQPRSLGYDPKRSAPETRCVCIRVSCLMLWKLDVGRKQRGLHQASSGDERMEEYEASVFPLQLASTTAIHFPPVTPFLLLLLLLPPPPSVDCNFSFTFLASVRLIRLRYHLTAFSRFPLLTHRFNSRHRVPPTLLPWRHSPGIVPIYLPVYVAHSDRLEHTCREFRRGTFNGASEKF